MKYWIFIFELFLFLTNCSVVSCNFYYSQTIDSFYSGWASISIIRANISIILIMRVWFCNLSLVPISFVISLLSYLLYIGLSPPPYPPYSRCPHYNDTFRKVNNYNNNNNSRRVLWRQLFRSFSSLPSTPYPPQFSSLFTLFTLPSLIFLVCLFIIVQRQERSVALTI